ncbi:MAG TPA: AraC family transcriptional regulator [Pirellulales bacterium]|nr:AraC family transcriptional regulator [Pirellulales bacterium]
MSKKPQSARRNPRDASAGQSREDAITDLSYLAYLRATPRPFLQFVSGHFPPGTVTQAHSHPCIALHGCLQGPLSLVLSQEETPLDAGAFYLLAPGVRHYWRNDGRQTGATLGVLIDAQRPGRWPSGAGVEECCGKLARAVQGIHRFNAAGDDELRLLFWLAADHLTALEPRETAATVGALWALVAQCTARLAAAPDSAAEPDDLAQRIRRLLLSRVNDRLSINDVARELQVSPTRAKEAFRKAFDCGIAAYHNQLKIWQAKRLLCNRTLTVEQVSRKLSFSTASYFSQVFLQHTGETPREFRRGAGLT